MQLKRVKDALLQKNVRLVVVNPNEMVSLQNKARPHTIRWTGDRRGWEPLSHVHILLTFLHYN